MKEYQLHRLKSIRKDKEYQASKEITPKRQQRALFQHLPPAHPQRKETAHQQLLIILSTRPFVSCLFVNYSLVTLDYWLG